MGLKFSIHMAAHGQVKGHLGFAERKCGFRRKALGERSVYLPKQVENLRKYESM